MREIVVVRSLPERLAGWAGLPFQGEEHVSDVGPRALPSASVGAALWAEVRCRINAELRRGAGCGERSIPTGRDDTVRMNRAAMNSRRIVHETVENGFDRYRAINTRLKPGVNERVNAGTPHLDATIDLSQRKAPPESRWCLRLQMSRRCLRSPFALSSRARVVNGQNFFGAQHSIGNADLIHQAAETRQARTMPERQVE